MSSQLKEVQQEENHGFYSAPKAYAEKNSRVNLNDLVNRLNLEKKKRKKE